MKILSIVRISVAVIVLLLVVRVGRTRFFMSSSDIVDDVSMLQENDIIERVIVLDDMDYALMSGDFVPEIIYKSPTTGDYILKDIYDVDFIGIYDQAKRSDDVKRQLSMLQEIYTKTNNQKLVPYLLNLSLQVREYAPALEYLQTLEQTGTLMDTIDPLTVFTLLFN